MTLREELEQTIRSKWSGPHISTLLSGVHLASDKWEPLLCDLFEAYMRNAAGLPFPDHLKGIATRVREALDG